MFTGLIEEVGRVRAFTPLGNTAEKKSARLTLAAPEISGSLKPGDSVALNGVCQTVIFCKSSSFSVECLGETLEKTNLGNLRPGRKVNLERALQWGSRLDGHMVQGHVSERGRLVDLNKRGNNRYIRIALSNAAAGLCIEEGSLAVDGISLTISSIEKNEVELNIIPHSWEKTNLSQLKRGDVVNIETDMVGRYIARLNQFRGGTDA